MGFCISEKIAFYCARRYLLENREPFGGCHSPRCPHRVTSGNWKIENHCPLYGLVQTMCVIALRTWMSKNSPSILLPICYFFVLHSKAPGN